MVAIVLIRFPQCYGRAEKLCSSPSPCRQRSISLRRPDPTPYPDARPPNPDHCVDGVQGSNVDSDLAVLHTREVMGISRLLRSTCWHRCVAGLLALVVSVMITIPTLHAAHVVQESPLSISNNCDNGTPIKDGDIGHACVLHCCCQIAIAQGHETVLLAVGESIVHRASEKPLIPSLNLSPLPKPPRA